MFDIQNWANGKKPGDPGYHQYPPSGREDYRDGGARPGGTESSNSILNAAKPFMGMPYVYGGNGSSDGGIDCSALSQQILQKYGIKIPRTADEQLRYFDERGMSFTDRNQLVAGDLVFMRNSQESGQGDAYKNVGHVGVYLGNNKVLQASYSAGGVVTSDMNSSWTDFAHTGISGSSLASNAGTSIGGFGSIGGTSINTANYINVSVPAGSDANEIASTIVKHLEQYQGAGAQINIVRQMREMQGVAT